MIGADSGFKKSGENFFLASDAVLRHGLQCFFLCLCHVVFVIE